MAEPTESASSSTLAPRLFKKPKRTLSPTSQQSASVDALFAHPDREIQLPSSSGPRPANAPPEIVANVQGSSAGAGSGEFHVYKASRRREYERLRAMDEETEREERDAEHETRVEGRRKEDEEALERNRKKREKARARKQRGKDGGEEEGRGKRKLMPAGALDGRKVEDEEASGDLGAVPGDAAGEEVGITIHDDD